MSSKFIDNLPMATTVNATDRLILSQENGITRRARHDQVVTLFEGNTVYVDAINGDDIKAQRATRRAYQSLSAAIAASIAGDTIIVLPGSYATTNTILKNGVNWHFRAGAIITFTNNASDNGLLDDNGQPIICRITGSGIFNRIEVAAGGTLTPHLVSVTNAGSNVDIEADLINSQQPVDGYAVWSVAGTLSIRARRIAATGSSAVAWGGGALYVRAEEISGAVVSYVQSPTTGDCVVDADVITNSGTAVVGGVVVFAGADPDAAMWVTANIIKNTGGGLAVNQNNASKLYVTAQKLFGAVNNSSTGLLYVSTQKWSAVANGSSTQGTFLNITNGRSYIKADHCDPLTFTSSTSGGSFRINGASANVNLEITDYVAGASSGGIFAVAGTIWLMNSRLDTSAAAAFSAVRVAGATINVLSSVLTSNGAKYDVEQTSGTVNVTGGRGTGTFGAFTTSGTVNFIGGKNYNLGAVTQATNVNTDVTLNASRGVITTQAATTAANGVESGFTVTNSAVVDPASVVIARVAVYGGTLGTNGIPDVQVDGIGGGFFHVRVMNVHATNALNGTMKIHFVVM